jgi:hypothetical protein
MAPTAASSQMPRMVITAVALLLAGCAVAGDGSSNSAVPSKRDDPADLPFRDGLGLRFPTGPSGSPPGLPFYSPISRQ